MGWLFKYVKIKYFPHGISVLTWKVCVLCSFLIRQVKINWRICRKEKKLFLVKATGLHKDQKTIVSVLAAASEQVKIIIITTNQITICSSEKPFITLYT